MLNRKIKDFLLTEGADLVGIARAEALKAAPVGHRPTDYLPSAKSIVSFAISLNRGAVTNLPTSRNEYLLEFESTNAQLNSLGFKTAKLLEKKGFNSLAVPATASIGDAVRLRGDISQKHAAVAAGLGLFGVNNLVLTPQYGARVRFGMVVTEADLQPDQLLEQTICSKCNKCVNACPAGALTDWEKHYDPSAGWRMDKEKCYHYIFVQLAGRRCGMCIGSCPFS